MNNPNTLEEPADMSTPDTTDHYSSTQGWRAHLPAPQVLLFDCNRMHASSTNISPVSRRNLFIVYCSLDNSVVEPLAAPCVQAPGAVKEWR